MSPQPHMTLLYIAEDSSKKLVKIAYIFIVLETLIFIAYFASRYLKPPSLGHRSMPYLMVGSYMFCVGLPILSLVIIYSCGAGHHSDTMPPHFITRRIKIDKAIESIYTPAVTLPKFAILFLYMNLFTIHNRRLLWLCYVTGGIMSTLLVFGVFSSFLSCRPYAYNWNKDIPGGQCFDIILAYRWISFPNIVTDIILMALCLPAIYRNKLPVVTKISLFFTFLLGSVGIVTSILRFVEFFRNDLFLDYAYNGSALLTWTLIEPGVYFMAAALLTTRPLFRWVLKDVKLPGCIARINAFQLDLTRRTSSDTNKLDMGLDRKEQCVEKGYKDIFTLHREPQAVKFKDSKDRVNRIMLEEDCIGNSGLDGGWVSVYHKNNL